MLRGRGVPWHIYPGYTRLKAATFAALPSVLKQGKIIAHNAPYEGHNYDSFIISAPVTIGEETVYVGALVIKDHIQRYKLHEVLTTNESGIPQIVETYDDVLYVPRKDGKSGIVYVKQHNGTTYYLEQIRNGNLLQNKQMIKTSTGTIPKIEGLYDAIDKKWGISTAPDKSNLPRMYVQDVWNNAPTDTIPQSGNIVNEGNSTESDIEGVDSESIENHRLNVFLPTSVQATIERTGRMYGVDPETIKRVKRIAEIIDRKIEFYSSDRAGENGYRSKRTNTIYVNAKSQNPVAQIIAHELTHTLEGTDGYIRLQTHIFDRIRNTTNDLDVQRENKIQLYTEKGEPLKDKTAVDYEIVAEFVEKNLLTNEASIRDFVRHEPKAGEWFLNKISSLLARLGNKQAQERVFLTTARDLYVSALKESRNTPTQTGVSQNVNEYTESQVPTKEDILPKSVDEQTEYTDSTAENISSESMDEQVTYTDSIEDDEYIDAIKEAYARGEISEETFDRLFDEYYSGGSESQFSFSETEDGRAVAVLDSDILKNIDTANWNKTTKEQAKRAAKLALDAFRDGVKVNGITYKVNRTSKREYTRSNDTEKTYRQTPEIFADKMRMAANANDIITATTSWSNDGVLTHLRNDSFVDFAHGKVLIQAGQNQYEADTVVGITKGGEYVFYDVVDMKPTYFKTKEESSTTAFDMKAVSDIQEDSSTGSITEPKQNVKQFSFEKPVQKSGEQKQEVLANLRKYVNGEMSNKAIREYIDGLDESGFGKPLNLPTYAQTEAQRLVRTAHDQNMSVEEYLNLNWENYEYDGGLNEVAKEALKFERQYGDRQYSIARMQNLPWEEQLRQFRHSDTLVVAKELYDFLTDDGIKQLPLAIPLRVLTKAQSGKDANHSLSLDSIYNLQEAILNAPVVVDNPSRNSLVFLTGLKDVGGYVVAAFEKNATFDNDKVHKATTIHTRNSPMSVAEKLGEDATIYIKKYNLDSNLREFLFNSGTLKAKIKIVNGSVAEDALNVNSKFSDNQFSFSNDDSSQTVPMRNVLTTKAREYLARVERGMLSSVANALGVDITNYREYLIESIQKISDECMAIGTVKQDTIDSLFEEAYSKVVSDEAID